MAFLPVSTSRVPFSLASRLAVENIALRQTQLSRVANELSTGRRINVPSDSPNEAVRAAILQRTTQLSTQFRDNIRQGSRSLSFADGLLRSFSDGIDSAKATAVLVLDGTRPDADVEAARIDIDSTIDSLVSIANRQYLDRYVFSGGRPTEAPFRRDGNYIVYTGDSTTLKSLQGVFETFGASVSADDSIGVFSRAGHGTDLAPDIDGATRLGLLNGGSGVARGSIRIDAGVGNPVTVDLQAADTIQDVIDIVNNDPTLQSQGVTLGLNIAGNGLAVTAGPGVTITVEEVSGGSTARDLGIVFRNAAIPAQGASVRATLSHTTPLSLLNAGAGVDTSVPIQITNGPYSATIDLSGAATVEDVLNAFNRAGVHVRAEINADGTGINVLNTLSGAGYSITEGSLTGAAASGLGILTTNLGSSLAEFNDQAGVDFVEGADIEITVGNGSVFAVDLSTAQTIADVKSIIESQTAGAVTVGVNPLGGLRLTDNTGGGSSNFTIRDLNGSGTAGDLGIDGSVAGGTEILGRNVYQAHVAGVFDTLLRIRDGLAARDMGKVAVAAQQIDVDQARVSAARGGLGARLNALQAFDDHLTASIEQTTLDASKILDADLSETATKLAMQQAALQAALASGGRLLQGSLLDFI